MPTWNYNADNSTPLGAVPQKYVPLGALPDYDSSVYRAARELMVARLKSRGDQLTSRLPEVYAERCLGWAQIGQRYDVTRLTVTDFVRMAACLFRAGLISPEDYTRLSFQSDVFSNPSANDPNSLIQRRCLTPLNTDGTRNWIAEYEAQMVQTMQDQGSDEDLEVEYRLLGHLRKLRIARSA